MSEVKQVEIKDKIYLNNSGWSANPLKILDQIDIVIHNLHIVSLEPGAERGNHCHDIASEWLIVFGGKAEIAFKSNDRDYIDQQTIEDAGPVMFAIPPNYFHAIKNISDKVIYAVAFNDAEEFKTDHCESLFNK